jgi:hypothetical protein
MPALKVSKRPQKINSAEIWPKGLRKVKLAIGALPKQETAQALLTAGSNK